MKMRVIDYLKTIIDIIRKPEMSILPANIAFFFVLAIIPLFTIIILLSSSFSISIDFIIELINDIFPVGVSTTVRDIILSTDLSSYTTIFNIIAFIIASNGTYSIIVSSNTLYKIEDSKVLRDRLKSFLILIIIVILFLFLLVVPILGNQIIKIIANFSNINNILAPLYTIYGILKWPLTFLIIYFNLKLIYTLAPSKQTNDDNTEGAFLTTTCWVIATAIFSYYINNFAKYDIIYGNLATIIILMIWIYALSFIFVLGMAINAVRYHKKEELKSNK